MDRCYADIAGYIIITHVTLCAYVKLKDLDRVVFSTRALRLQSNLVITICQNPEVNIAISRISLYIGMTNLDRAISGPKIVGGEPILYDVLARFLRSPPKYPPNYHQIRPKIAMLPLNCGVSDRSNANDIAVCRISLFHIQKLVRPPIHIVQTRISLSGISL